MVNYFIVGSTVMQKFGFKVEPKDLDIFYIKGTKKPFIKCNRRVEYHTLPKELFDKFITRFDYPAGHSYLTPESLYVLKLSHAEYNIHWQKTVKHIHMLKRDLKEKYRTADIFDALPEQYRNLFYDLKEFWKTVHKSKRNIKLNANKDKFFNNRVQRKYDHDLLHEIVKYSTEPMYKKCLKDGQDVFLDEKKFNALTHRQKLQLCREEIYVIALERFLIPNNFKLCEHECYRAALKKLVTTMTKGWFPTYICDNYDQLNKVDKNYMKIFKKYITRIPM